MGAGRFFMENLLESFKSFLLPEIEEEKYPKSGPGMNEYQRIPTLLTIVPICQVACKISQLVCSQKSGQFNKISQNLVG
jgi:hypothetical protein